MADPTLCSRINCTMIAVANPQLLAWAKSTPPENRRADNCACYRLRLPICQLHAASSNVDDFMTDEGWSNIEKLHAAQRLAPPDRNSAKLEWVHLLPGDA